MARDTRSMPGPGDLWRRRDNPYEAPDPTTNHECECGWEGYREDAVLNEPDEDGIEHRVCPDCGRKVRRICDE